uniref:Ionotropic glutamate receptor C-terminal domain-containing protein n=1 Tax=Tetranychus urticae TaxID=32264 RepID=T1JZN6_TETUR
MNLNFQFKFGFIDRGTLAIYDPLKNRYVGQIARFMNKNLERFASVNFTVVVFGERVYGDCDSVNCTGLMGRIERGEIDLVEFGSTFATIPLSITGLKPGAVVGDVSCNIFSALPETGITREDTNSPPIVWPLICAILRQDLSKQALFYTHTLRFIWMSIILIIFLMTALYTGSFTTDLAAKVPIKTIDSLEDVADSDRIPFWMEDPFCRAFVNSNPSRAGQEIMRRAQYITLGDSFGLFMEQQIKIEKYVFFNNPYSMKPVRLGNCVKNVNRPMPQWHQSTGSFPVYPLFSILNSKLSPDATKIINLLCEKNFQSHVEFHLLDKWNSYLYKMLDPEQKSGCLHKTFISSKPALYP